LKTNPSKKGKTSQRQNLEASILVIGDDSLVAEYSAVISASHFHILPPEKIRSLKAVAKNISLAIELSNLNLEQKKKNLVELDAALPPTTAILSSSVTVPVLEQAQWIQLKHRLTGIAALPSLLQNSLVEVAPSAHTLEATMEVVKKFFASLGKEIAIVQDRVGLVLPRILCQIINEAMFAVQTNVASPNDIDTAMKLGTNYPLGPIEWGEKIGFDHVHATLEALFNDMHEERYRACPLLKQLAVTGKFWLN
jgi:3-hydroxybutyryl-CoA dehydrogenase